MQEESTSFDLGEIASASAEADLTVMHPVTGAKTDIVITLLSSDNPVVKERQRRHFKGVLKAQREKREEEILDDVDENELAVLVAATVRWKCADSEDEIKFKGKLLPCSAENARKVYAEVPAIAEQVRLFITQRANFMKR
jgi:hypothetical protein